MINKARAQLIAQGLIKPCSIQFKRPVRACEDRIKNMDTNKAKTAKAVAILNAALQR